MIPEVPTITINVIIIRFIDESTNIKLWIKTSSLVLQSIVHIVKLSVFYWKKKYKTKQTKNKNK